MDYARDNGQVSNSDRENVFSYQPGSGPTTLALALNGKEMMYESLRTEAEWDALLDNDCFPLDGSVSGLVLMIPQRGRKREAGTIEPEPGNENWGRLAADMDYHTLDSNRGGLRTLPMSDETFRRVTRKFFMHGDIARIISRADIPSFSMYEVRMSEYPAYVIHCRTSNAWGMDLAMTCTFFPHCMLTFATVLGCTPLIEADIRRRVCLGLEEAAHPLLVAGIIAELERVRHAGIVDHNTDKLETRIIELEIIGADMHHVPEAETTQKNVAKRNDWLDMSYLRNQLVAWNVQLGKMAAGAEEFSSRPFIPRNADSAAAEVADSKPGEASGMGKNEGKPPRQGVIVSSTSQRGGRLGEVGAVYQANESPSPTRSGAYVSYRSPFTEDDTFSGKKDNVGSEKYILLSAYDSRIFNPEIYQPSLSEEAMKNRWEHNQRMGQRFAIRFKEIGEEYEDKIRECKMRLEGMAMASQWAEGETNVQIALEMKRDSRHMRSIALVTMVFLPGTFFASLFSMTFFNWFPDSGDEKGGGSAGSGDVVSKWVALWVGFTVVATSATFAFWWYFIVYREAQARKLRAKQITDDQGAATA